MPSYTETQVVSTQPAQQINSPGSIFGTMLSEWSWPTLQVGKLSPHLFPLHGAPQTPPVFHLSPSQSLPIRDAYNSAPFRPPSASPKHCTSRYGYSNPRANSLPHTQNHTRSPGCQAANQRAAVRIRALSDSWNRPGLHLADAAHHQPLMAEVKLLLLPCARRQPPKGI